MAQKDTAVGMLIPLGVHALCCAANFAAFWNGDITARYVMISVLYVLFGFWYPWAARRLPCAWATTAAIAGLLAVTALLANVVKYVWIDGFGVLFVFWAVLGPPPSGAFLWMPRGGLPALAVYALLWLLYLLALRRKIRKET